MKKFFPLILSILLCTASLLNAKENNTPSTQLYTIIKSYAPGVNLNSPPFHPRMKDAKNEFTMLSVQDEDLLRVFFYYPDGSHMGAPAFDVHNPSKRSFNGIPAKYQYKEPVKTDDEEKDVIIFADGTEFKPYLPPDAVSTGGTEWTYYIRWRKVHGNYYFVTFYRAAGALLYTALMTEKKGQDLGPVLGESSATADMSKYFMGGVDEPVILQYKRGEQTPGLDMTLIPVEEKDLPPDFPKGLVRWIP